MYKGPECTIYKELLQFNNRQITQLKLGQIWKKYIQMANKHMKKKRSTSLAIKEMQIKTTMRSQQKGKVGRPHIL